MNSLDPLKHLMKGIPTAPPAPELPYVITPTDPSIRDVIRARGITVADILSPHYVDWMEGSTALTKPEDIELDDLDMGLTSAKVTDLCCLIESGSDRSTACRLIGLSAKQLGTWLRDAKNEPSKHPLVEARRRHMVKIATAIAQSEAVYEKTLTGTLFEAVRQANSVDAAKWLLEHHPNTKQRWGKATQVEHKGKVSHVHKAGSASIKPSDLSDEDLETLQKMLTRSAQAQPTANLLPAPTDGNVLELEVEP